MLFYINYKQYVINIQSTALLSLRINYNCNRYLIIIQLMPFIFMYKLLINMLVEMKMNFLRKKLYLFL